MTRFMHILALSIWSSAAAAETHDEPRAPACEAFHDAQPWLLHLWHRHEVQGLRVEAIRMHFACGDDPVAVAWARYFEALAAHSLKGAEDADVLFIELERSGKLGRLPRLARARTWLDTNPALSQALIESTSVAGDAETERWMTALRAHSLVSQGLPIQALSVLKDSGAELTPRLHNHLISAKWKSPTLGAVMSAIVPGSGHVYSGQLLEGLSACLVVGLFGAGTAWAVGEQRWASAAVAGFFGMGFWAGNVYGAADAAIRKNRKTRDRLRNDLDGEVPVPDWPLPHHRR